ncbi:MAG: hypothetical protein SF052_18065 [Bacteroidia bacterium]|nr:hypothetical protein [Bacteroidia bacterium]
MINEWPEVSAKMNAGYSIRVPEEYRIGGVYDIILRENGSWRWVERERWGLDTPTYQESAPLIRFAITFGGLPYSISITGSGSPIVNKGLSFIVTQGVKGKAKKEQLKLLENSF